MFLQSWSVQAVTPSYGPIAGGTEVTISGPYITNPKLNLTVVLRSQEVPFTIR